ncbi:ankyrin repeat domain-containing protein [Flavobacterium gawalongense]|uniref:Ankyrin repeat domain-containing protein n=1 Tax=Flavobacterium gawalongense TaxID=2594432 RepID=A0A553BN31_9FLAO|nr:ankyrin repeat domain-containing protein [Flavobacterium gawalongense]TRX09656.1 ankyrin repeat domain-containing protein [Flavobacterium gawalongense]TRX10881.1 ankyrin repeat domain-containing protein [Flavobacterium gawalongense]TRX28061.1 ankyrin repeat domain-containing protein [Flavobacterium gawalongense]
MKSVQDIKLLMVEGNDNDLPSILEGFDVNSFDRNGDNILHNYILSTSQNSSNFSPKIFIDELVKRGFDLNAVQSKSPNRSALHLAIATKNKIITEILISLKVVIDTIDKNGNTPLCQAIMNYRNDDPFFIKILISNGADKNIENMNGISPLKLSNTIANYDSKHLLS